VANVQLHYNTTDAGVVHLTVNGINFLLVVMMQLLVALHMVCGFYFFFTIN